MNFGVCDFSVIAYFNFKILFFVLVLVLFIGWVLVLILVLLQSHLFALRMGNNSLLCGGKLGKVLFQCFMLTVYIAMSGYFSSLLKFVLLLRLWNWKLNNSFLFVSSQMHFGVLSRGNIGRGLFLGFTAIASCGQMKPKNL